MGVFLYFLTCCILFVSTNEAARILAVFPVPSISHQVVFRPLTQELAKRGHDVTVITTDPAFPKGGAPANLTEIDVHDISYKFIRQLIDRLPRGIKVNHLEQIISLLDVYVKLLDIQLKDENVKRLIKDKSQKFDLLIIEGVVRPALVFSHIYKAPVIQMSSLGGTYDTMEVMGAPSHPLLYPNVIHQKINNLSWWDKVVQAYSSYAVKYAYYKNQDLENKFLKEHFGPETPPVSELCNNIDLIFLNVNPVYEGNYPVPPSIVYTGGLHVKPEKELPQNLKSYLDSSKNGVIYISFGTNTDPTLLPPERIQVLVKAFSELPYDVLWKWNGDELPGRTANIRISKWLPQTDLLRHLKIKVFITQGGQQSTDEAITAGVPLIGIPMIGDQWYNVEKYVKHNIGVRLDFDEITVKTFKETLMRVINDDSYRKNILRLRTLMRDQVQTPLERAVWWTEYVLRHGGAKHLRSPAANISWAEYLELELVLTLLAGLFVTLLLFIFTVYKLYKILTKNKVTGIKVKCN